MSSFALKMIAIITMLIDHAAFAFAPSLPTGLYYAMRSVGRLAMPIFCFMIAEGFFHTRSVKKYALRLGVFALISELPFDLLFTRGMVVRITEQGKWWNFGHQNVFFTLLLGLLGIWFFDMCAAKNRKVLALLSIVFAGVAAQLLGTDYGIFGVFFIFAFYVMRGNRLGGSAAFAIGVLAFTSYNVIQAGRIGLSSLFWLFHLAALIPVWLYNGKKGPGGRIVKYSLYVFYPAHILILFAIRYALYGF